MTTSVMTTGAMTTNESTASEGVTDALNRDAVEERSVGEPEWLRERRLEAWDIYESLPLPTTASERWRYTDLKRLLKLASLELAVAPDSVDPSGFPAQVRAALATDQAASGHVVEIDGRVVHVDLDEALAKRGVVLTSLREAAHSHPDVLRRHLGTEAVPASEGKFQALNGALWSDGVLCVLPRNVELEHPIRVTRWASDPGKAYFTRTLLVAEPHSRASFVEESLSPDFEQQSLYSSAIELLAADGAQVQYVSLQEMGRGVFHLSQQRTLAQRDSTLDTLNVNLGASVARLDLNARLLGPGANSDMLGLYFGDGNQHFDSCTSQDHVAPNSKSDLLYKGALDERARSVFRGIIKVHPKAQGTDAYQTNRNLLLSRQARADSLPNLEIEADDVKCSHGATVGQLDQEALFYLMSRGLDWERAERIVVLGFLGEVLRRLPLGGVVEKVTRSIEAKLARV